MPNVSNPDDAMMKKQQGDDLGHPEEHPADGAVEGIRRLPEGVNSDGMLPSGHLHDESAETRSQREAAIDKSQSAGGR